MGMVQNTSGGVLSGDFSRKLIGFLKKHTENPPGFVFCIIPIFWYHGKAFLMIPKYSAGLPF